MLTSWDYLDKVLSLGHLAFHPYFFFTVTLIFSNKASLSVELGF